MESTRGAANAGLGLGGCPQSPPEETQLTAELAGAPSSSHKILLTYWSHNWNRWYKDITLQNRYKSAYKHLQLFTEFTSIPGIYSDLQLFWTCQQTLDGTKVKIPPQACLDRSRLNPQSQLENRERTFLSSAHECELKFVTITWE